MPKGVSKSDSSVFTTNGSRKVSVVLPPEVAARVERLAVTRGTSLSKVCVDLILAGEGVVHDQARQDAVAVLQDVLESSQKRNKEDIERAIRMMSGRLANLLARSALESISARYAFMHGLAENVEWSKVREINQNAWQNAVSTLNKPSNSVREGLKLLLEGNETVAVSGQDEVLKVLQELKSELADIRQHLKLQSV